MSAAADDEGLRHRGHRSGILINDMNASERSEGRRMKHVQRRGRRGAAFAIRDGSEHDLHTIENLHPHSPHGQQAAHTRQQDARHHPLESCVQSILKPAKFMLAPAPRVIRELLGLETQSPAFLASVAEAVGFLHDLDLATPERLWWVPLRGWPADGWPTADALAIARWRAGATNGIGVAKYGRVPPKVEPVPAAARALCPPSSEAIGELRLEIMEARELRRTDLVTGADPYALVLFEGSLARTNTVHLPH